MSARVAVLGSAGMVGSAITRYLSDQQPLGLDRAAYEVGSGAEGLQLALSELKPGDLVINAIGALAADLREDGAESQAQRLNARFPHVLAEVTSDLELRLVHVSTDGVYGPTAGIAVESTPPDAKDLYGTSKLAGEPTAGHAISLRCSPIGPSPRGRGLWSWVAQAPAAAVLDGYTDHLWSGLTTRQLAATCGRLADPVTFEAARAEGPVHHVAPNAPVTKYQLLCWLAALLRPDISVRPVRSDRPCCRILLSQHETLSQPPNQVSDWPELLASAQRLHTDG